MVFIPYTAITAGLVEITPLRNAPKLTVSKNSIMISTRSKALHPTSERIVSSWNKKSENITLSAIEGLCLMNLFQTLTCCNHGGQQFSFLKIHFFQFSV
jgi:hypothetical protein